MGKSSIGLYETNTQLLEKISPEHIVDTHGQINNAKLRQFIIQETGLAENDKFLTDYTSAIDFEFQCADGSITPEILTKAIRNLLLQQASIENFHHFQFKKNPDPNDPFQLEASDFQELFNCIEISTGSCLYGSLACIGVTAASGIGLVFAIPAFFALILLSPFFALANRAGHLATITNRETPAAALATWMMTLTPTALETYFSYHHLFKAINNRMNGEIEHDKAALFVSHVFCLYIMAMVFAINVAIAGKVSEKYQIAERFPSEKFNQLLQRMKSIGQRADLNEPRNSDQKTLSKALSETNFPAFLMKGKEMGAQYEKAVQLIMQTHLLSIEKQSAAAATHSVQMPDERRGGPSL